jgi:hypothetical protein
VERVYKYGMGMGVYDASGGCDGLVIVDDSDPKL